MFKKKVAIIEIYGHHVFVHTLASSLVGSGYEVTVYSSDRIFKDLDPLFRLNEARPTFCVSERGESDFSFLKRIKPEINKRYELLFINTIQGHRIGYFYLFKFNVPTIAAAGRISEFFGSNLDSRENLSFRQILQYHYTKFLLPKVVKRLCGLIVHTEKAKSLAESKGYNKPIHCMPFSLHLLDLPVARATSENVNFLITGSMTNRARDYFSVLRIFEEIWESGERTPALTVLSSPKTKYGFKVYEELERLGRKGYPITFFSSWISESEFLHNSAQADFLIAPIKKEYYGAGEITSVEVESVRMGIPAIYPDWYFVNPDRKAGVIQYSSFSHLKNLVVGYSKDRVLLQNQRIKALKNAEKFSVKPVSMRLANFLNNEIEVNLFSLKK